MESAGRLVITDHYKKKIENYTIFLFAQYFNQALQKTRPLWPRLTVWNASNFVLDTDDSAKLWKPYGCTQSEIPITDKRGFRQCIIEGNKPSLCDRKQKLSVLNDLRKKQQVPWYLNGLKMRKVSPSKSGFIYIRTVSSELLFNINSSFL